MKRRALITGVTGQDGSYLAEFLLERGYQVFGLARSETWMRPNNASHLATRINILHGDLEGGIDLFSALQSSQPDEIYNLASQSRPAESWGNASETLTVNAMGALKLFDAVRHATPKARVYQASSSEMFGQAEESPQIESTAFNPCNPYAATKAFAHHLARIYRGSYGLYISSGILFNHESERRPLHFVTQKVAYGAACAALGLNHSPDNNELGLPIVADGKLSLGTLDIARDWGHAADYVRAMWMMLQLDVAQDFVIGTGQLRTLKTLCEVAYSCVGLNWQDHVVSKPALARPMESNQTVADASKARLLLGWEPTINFESMIQRMVESQINRLERRNSGV